MKRKNKRTQHYSLLFPDAVLLGSSCGSCGAGFTCGGGAMDDMTGALLPPPQLLLMLVMVLTQALAGSAVGRLSACWNGIISSCRKIMLLLVRTQSVHTYSYSRTDTVKKKKKKKKKKKGAAGKTAYK